jgi:hypothetical protein
LTPVQAPLDESLDVMHRLHIFSLLVTGAPQTEHFFAIYKPSFSGIISGLTHILFHVYKGCKEILYLLTMEKTKNGIEASSFQQGPMVLLSNLLTGRGLKRYNCFDIQGRLEDAE